MLKTESTKATLRKRGIAVILLSLTLGLSVTSGPVEARRHKKHNDASPVVETQPTQPVMGSSAPTQTSDQPVEQVAPALSPAAEAPATSTENTKTETQALPAAIEQAPATVPAVVAAPTTQGASTPAAAVETVKNTTTTTVIETKPAAAPASPAAPSAPHPVAKPKPVAEGKPGAAKPANKPVTAKKLVAPARMQEAETDSAMLSVLRDIVRGLRESEDAAKIQNPAEKAAFNAAVQTLELALSKTQNNPNRIINPEHKDYFESAVTAEAWESGPVQLPNNHHASFNVLWAKKVNGLVNVCVTGTCGSGEFVVVINGRSSLDSGFDIQSQSNVSYWIGKLTNFSVDAASGDKVSSSGNIPLLHALSTEIQPRIVKAEPSSDAIAALPLEAATASKKHEGAGANVKAAGAQSEIVPPPPVKADGKTADAAAEVGATAATAGAEQASAIAAVTNAQGSVSPDAAIAEPRLPSADAVVVAPDRALAGDYITVSVLRERSHKPEAQVQLVFNGTQVLTNKEGVAMFRVPEDLSPGPSLEVSFSAKPDFKPLAVTVFQPLLRPSGQQVPRIDKVTEAATAGGTIIIDGHNFDGLSANNHVLIDGTYEGKVLVASPVQLKAVMPRGIAPGQHSVLVNCNGLRSNASHCKLVAVCVEGPTKSGKNQHLMLRVLGTQGKVRLTLQNDTPNVIKLLKGNVQTVETAGGAKNVATLVGRKIGKGVIHISAKVESVL